MPDTPPRFKCPKCQYTTNHKGHMKNHMNRKIDCHIDLNSLVVQNHENKSLPHDATEPPPATTIQNITYHINMLQKS